MNSTDGGANPISLSVGLSWLFWEDHLESGIPRARLFGKKWPQSFGVEGPVDLMNRAVGEKFLKEGEDKTMLSSREGYLPVLDVGRNPIAEENIAACGTACRGFGGRGKRKVKMWIYPVFQVRRLASMLRRAA